MTLESKKEIKAANVWMKETNGLSQVRVKYQLQYKCLIYGWGLFYAIWNQQT